MLNLFQSNQTRLLADKFCERAASQRDPMKPMQVVVQSFGMGQWLKLQLAEKKGISANVNCQLPAAFLWHLYRQLIPEAANLEASPFSSEHLAFRIMRLIKGGLRLSPAVTRYLQQPGDEDLRLYQLSSEIARLLDQYLMFRPEWMLKWEHQATEDEAASIGYHDKWQRELWRALLADMPQDQRQLHRAKLHQRLQDAFDKRSKGGEVAPEQLPERLSIFGLATLPPLQLQTFEAMGNLTEVDLYFLNPCEHYWGDIVSPKDKARHSIRQMLGKDDALQDADYLEIGNPILSSLGKQGREFFELLQDYGHIASDVREDFQPFEGDSALTFVKNDILNLTHAGEFLQPGMLPPRIKLPEKQSLQIHNCYSRLREVEVLHDQLLHIISDNPDIALADIIVMVPDIGHYAPLIQTVFGEPLHYRLNDRSQAAGSPLLASFLQLLDLPYARLTGSEILDLLESQAVRRKLNLQQADLDLLATWIRETNIRWELDGKARHDRWAVPAIDQNTWRFGLDRLLLGFARAREAGPWRGTLGQDTLGYDIKAADADLVGKLASLIDRLAAYRAAFGKPRKVPDWVSLISAMQAEFFDPDLDEIPDQSLISRSLEQLADNATEAGLTTEISFNLMHHLLQGALTEQRPARGFLAGGITFATLVPMRSIPFKVICLLGMNDGDYPRDKRPHSFDLMHLDGHRKGDRSRKLDDRYLFLEALLSAERVFYVSYLGMGVRDNKEKPPSVVLGEWQAYLESVFDGFKVTQNPLQPFNRKHYEGGPLQSFSDVWVARQPTETAMPRFAPEPLGEDDSLALTSLAQLERFFQHSGRYFLQQRLGVWLDEEDATLPETEPFQLDGLEKYQLADDALATLMKGGDLEQWRESEMASGSVMVGEAGEQQLQQEIDRAEAVHDTIKGLVSGEACVLTGVVDGVVVGATGGGVDVDGVVVGATGVGVGGVDEGGADAGSGNGDGGADVDVGVGEVKGGPLVFSLPDFYPDEAGGKLLNYRVGKLQDRHLLVAWIRHLVACASAGASEGSVAGKGADAKGGAGEGAGGPEVDGVDVDGVDAGGVDVDEKGIFTVCVSRDNKGKAVMSAVIPPLPRDEAKKELRNLTALYAEGTTRPLLLAPESCRAFVETLNETSSQTVALAKARERFEGGYGGGEADRYRQRLFASTKDFDKEFGKNALTIWHPLLAAINNKDD